MPLLLHVWKHIAVRKYMSISTTFVHLVASLLVVGVTLIPLGRSTTIWPIVPASDNGW
jgi:hypothetical protein